jgi:hypothetical protein
MWFANGYVNVALVTGCPSGSQTGLMAYSTL